MVCGAVAKAMGGHRDNQGPGILGGFFFPILVAVGLWADGFRGKDSSVLV